MEQPIYFVFGQLLTALRRKSGIGKQAELAKQLGVAQQTLSRWERGFSRPRPKQLALIAALLAADEQALSRAAGYLPSGAGVAFDRPFPVNALSPESFERFCASLLERLYRDRHGEVHRAGTSGHRQDGIDIAVSGTFGRHTFQCKRVNEFGPQKVRAAVAAHTAQANRKFLLLSNVASPQARAALADRSDWELWDREDISARVRSLPAVDRRELVDMFFRGQRLELLGELEAGPWMTPAQFFGPYLDGDRLFNHTWSLVGRASEMTTLDGALRDESIVATLLVGAPGIGKTRLLRHAVESLETRPATPQIWFLSPTEEVTNRFLEELGGGNKLLVVDDAHDREDLLPLFRYCAVAENHARLLLALRPHGLERVRHQAASLSLCGPTIFEVEIQRPTKQDAEQLASLVLKARGGPVAAARVIADVTFDNPLTTVVGAQLAVRENIHPALLGNVQDFRTQILARFEDVIAGHIVTGQDVDRLRGALRILSLVQPVFPDDPRLLSLLHQVEHIEEADATRLLRILAAAGVLFRRGLRHRLSPDLLADSIITRYCIKADGSSNGYVERVFDHAQGDHLNNLLVNLARLDWRVTRGDTADSHLLDAVWRRLRWQDSWPESHVVAATAAAYYEPRLALDFAARLVRDGHGGEADVCRMVKNAAYHINFLDEACALLWQAGRDDSRPLHQHPYHPIRVLKELAQFEPEKPREYIEKVVAFALALLDTPNALTGVNTPFDVLEGALAAEGHSVTAANARIFTMAAYTSDRAVVADVRERVISSLLGHIATAAPRRAFLAARTLAWALRSPIGVLGLRVSPEESLAWEQEHIHTLERLERAVEGRSVHPAVLVRLAESIAWHAFHEADEGQMRAKTLMSLLHRDLETRFVRAVMDDWGTKTWQLRGEDSEAELFEDDVAKLISDLRSNFNDPTRLCDFVEKWIREVESAAGSDYQASQVFMNRLLTAAPGVAREILQRHQRDGTSLAVYAGLALSVLLQSASSESREQMRALAEAGPDGLRLVAEAYARFQPANGYLESDVALLQVVFNCRNRLVLQHVGQAALQVTRCDRALALDLICSVDLVAAGHAGHDVFMCLCHKNGIPTDVIREEQWRRLLTNIEALQELDDYWIRHFLKDASRVVPGLVVEMLTHRLNRARSTGDWGFHPLQPSHGREEGLDFLNVPSSVTHMKSLLDWALKDADSSRSMYAFGELVAGLCGKYEKVLLDLLTGWMSGGTDQHAKVVASVLREAQSDIIFDYPDFVHDVLTAAQVIGVSAVRVVSSALFAATRTGIRSTIPGEPFPEDVKLERHASSVLSLISRFDPAYELFADLLRTAREGIASQQREKEAMASVDTSEPAISGRLKTGHHEGGGRDR